MPEFVDQLNRTVSISLGPQKIISCVPSQTELLFDLGLDKEIAGITKFCVHPNHWFRTKTRIGGTKKLNLEKIAATEPDLILANKEENTREEIEWLSERFPVWVSDISNLQDALEMILSVGQITVREKKANEIVQTIALEFEKLKTDELTLRTCYLIWQNPFITVGADTFIHDMMIRTGFLNVFQDQARYPEIELDHLTKNGCELVILSTEPFPFSEKHVAELSSLLPGIIVLLADGEYFSWYGSRLMKAPDYFRSFRARALSVH